MTDLRQLPFIPSLAADEQGRIWVQSDDPDDIGSYVLTPILDAGGQLVVRFEHITGAAGPMRLPVAWLVHHAFTGEPICPTEPINGDPADTRPENLRPATG
jgi:hypothetical protein